MEKLFITTHKLLSDGRESQWNINCKQELQAYGNIEEKLEKIQGDIKVPSKIKANKLIENKIH